MGLVRAAQWLAPGSEVVTDGLGCWRVLGEGAYWT